MGALDNLFATDSKKSKNALDGIFTKPKPKTALDSLFATGAAPVPPPVPQVTQPPAQPILAPGPRVSLLPKATISAPGPNLAERAIAGIGSAYSKAGDLAIKATDYVAGKTGYPAAGKFLREGFSAAAEKFPILPFKPSTVASLPGVAKEAVKSVGDTFTEAFKTAEDVIATSGQDSKTVDRVNAMGYAGLAALNTMFTFPTAVTRGATQLPEGSFGKQAADLVEAGMSVVSKGGGAISDKIFDVLPQTEAIQQYRPLARDITGALALVAVGKGLHEATKLPGEIKKFREETISTNDIVKSAQKILDIPSEKNVLQQIKKTDADLVQQKYREIAHEVHPDKGGTVEGFKMATTARDILTDYAKLSPKEFQAKYKETLAGVNTVIKQIPVPEEIFVEKNGEMVPQELPKVAEPSKALTAEQPKTVTPRVVFEDTPLHNRVMNELVGAEKGTRVLSEVSGGGMKFTGKKSTFPQWIPEELRRKPLLDAVSKHIMEGTEPVKAAEKRLYNLVADEMNAQSEVLNDNNFIQTQRNNLHDPFATPAENAAALAKFDTEYAKLKAIEPKRTTESRGEVQRVGEPVQTKLVEEKSTKQSAREEVAGVKLERKLTAEEFVASKEAKLRAVPLKDSSGQFVKKEEYYVPKKAGLPALHPEDYASLTDFLDLTKGELKGTPEFEAKIDKAAIRVLDEVLKKGVENKSLQEQVKAAQEVIASYQAKGIIPESVKFRLKDDLAKKGIEVTDAQEAAIIELNKKIFGDSDVRVMGQILANEKALGKYQDGIIEILSGQADAQGTFYHEAVHKYLDVFTDKAEHVAILNEGQKKYGIDDFAQIEELLAEDFIKYAKDRTGITGTLKTLFDSVLQRITKFLGNQSKIDALYQDIISGKAKEKMGESKVATSIKTKALEQGIEDSFGDIAQYTKVTIKEQAQRVSDLISENPTKAREIVLGNEPLPEGILGGTMIKAMEDLAMDTKDVQLLIDIAKSPLTAETSVHAQEMRMLAERNPDSAVANIQQVQKMRQERVKRLGVKKETVIKDIKESIKKAHTKESWGDFISSIEC